ncbi:SDR family oxidoreductase [Fibrella aquatilis]|uniref:SDR family oxidoreductase n=1 Tax=Fibrella aquatilis TaxID=2817059 RepID=A0A939JZF1_9BACT|nr:SDR family oxidoreductase [Fibrella aquatilis]MBO0931343.1 SDR family oxidoreductase [Fibrella aquatilis]
MILITGATGHLGTSVIQTLLTKTPANEVVALVRNETKADRLEQQGVNIRVGDYNNTEALDRAMQGVDKVLLIAGGDAPNGLQQHQNVVDAAKKAGVGYMAYTSRSLKDPDTLVNQLMMRHFETEDYIKASGLTYALLRNSLYMDTLPVFTGPAVFETGIALPAGQGRVAFALRREQGEAIANVLMADDGANRIYNFTGSDAYSFDDVAAALTELSGKPVTYTNIDPTVMAERMKGRGVPDTAIQRTIGFMTDIKHGQEAPVSTDLETWLGRKPASLRDGLPTLYTL